jgi:hypothetical protein
MAKNFSTFFFSLSFVCIGMDTRLKDIVSRENRNLLFSFLGAQIFNIIVTMLIAWLMFGIVKPALWPTTEAPAKVEEASQNDNNLTLKIEGIDENTTPDKNIEMVKLEVVK